MSKTYRYVLLRAIVLSLTFAMVLWTFNVSTLKFVQAANVTSFSVTLSDSAPNADVDIVVQFTTPNGLNENEDITLTLEDFANISSITSSDIELDVDGVSEDIGADWTFSQSGSSIVLTSNTGTTIPDDSVVVVRIGENTTSGSNQLTNPAVTGAYLVQLELDSGDSGETQVAIVDAVTVSATVDTIFTFTITGVSNAESVNGDTTSTSTTATEIEFGLLTPGTPVVAAQDLQVETNASNGFAVTVESDGAFASSAGGVIQSFIEGSDTSTPVSWSSPTGNVLDESTWSHWGMTSNDATSTIPFGVGEYVAVATSPTVVFSHNGPADGSTQNVGTARVGYKVEISALQPAANDYSTTLTYIATPTF